MNEQSINLLNLSESHTIPAVFWLQNGLTALHLAAKEGHLDVVNQLVQLGADINACSKVRKRTRLHRLFDLSGSSKETFVSGRETMSLGLSEIYWRTVGGSLGP